MIESVITSLDDIMRHEYCGYNSQLQFSLFIVITIAMFLIRVNVLGPYSHNFIVFITNERTNKLVCLSQAGLLI